MGPLVSSWHWLVAFDPIMRFTIWALGPPSSLVGYADDLGVATASLVGTLATLIRLFAIFFALGGLEMNWPKIVVAPIWRVASPVLVKSVIGALFPHLVDIKVQLSAKHLGVQIGPSAHLSPWGEVCPKTRERAIS